MLSKKKHKKLAPDKVKRASSEISYFDRHKEVSNSRTVLDEIWESMTLAQRVNLLGCDKDEKGRGIFTRAVRHLDYTLVELLLKNEAIDVNERDMYGNTALHHAVLVKAPIMIRLLLESKRILVSCANDANLSVVEMLKELEETGVFIESFHTYCYSLLPDTSYYH